MMEYRTLTYISIYYDVKYITQIDDFSDMSNLKQTSQPPDNRRLRFSNI